MYGTACDIAGLIIYTIVWLDVGHDVFCGSVYRVVRNLAVPYSAPVLSSELGATSRGTIPFQPIDVPHLSDEARTMSVLSISYMIAKLCLDRKFAIAWDIITFLRYFFMIKPKQQPLDENGG